MKKRSPLPPARSPEEARWRQEVEGKLGREELEAHGYPWLGLPEDDLARYEERLGFPARPPFTRGIQPTMYRGRLWTMRQSSGFGTAAETNERFRELLAHGQTGLAVGFDLPTQQGFDADQARSKGKVGRAGVSIGTVADMDRLFAGIALDKTAVSMAVNATAPVLVGLLVNVAETRGVALSKLGGTVQNDPLQEHAVHGTSVFPPEASLRLAVDLITFASREMPLWNSISVSGYALREAGATAAQEVAFALADGLAYAQAAAARGLSVEEFLPRLSFFFSAHRNFLEEIAKFRAARRLWASLAKEVLKASSARAQELRFHTQTAGSSLATQQPELNVIRTTMEALSAVLGGTQSLHTSALDEALGPASAPSARLALRTQQLLAEESGVGNSVDPLGGAWAIEELTDQVEEEARRCLDEISALGGAPEAVRRGFYQRAIAQGAERRARALSSSEAHVVGVTVHTDANRGFLLFPERGAGKGRRAPKSPRVSPEVERKAAGAVKAWKRSRDAQAVEAGLAKLRRATERGENVMPTLIAALRAKATLGEVSGLWRELFGGDRTSPEN